MYLYLAEQFRIRNSLTIEKLSNLTGIDEKTYADIEALTAEADEKTTAALAAYYGIKPDDLGGNTDKSLLSDPKTDKWHFFPAAQSPQNNAAEPAKIGDLSFIEKELITAFREADAAEREEVFKALSKKDFSKRAADLKMLNEKILELIEKERELLKREQKLCEREEALLNEIFNNLNGEQKQITE